MILNLPSIATSQPRGFHEPGPYQFYMLLTSIVLVSKRRIVRSDTRIADNEKAAKHD